LDDDGLNCAVNNFAPGTPFWRGRAAIIEADHDVTGGSGCTVEIIIPDAPLVEHGLSGGFAIHVNKKRIFFCGIKMRGLEHPAVERDAISAIDLEKFGGR